METPHSPASSEGWNSNEELIENNPELHHYTTRSGLKGILSSNTLYATNFLNLNDNSEITHLKEPWEEDLKIGLISALQDRQKISRRTKNWIRSNGGLNRIAEIESNKFTVVNYITAFIGHQNPAMAIPFISSFCSHAEDHTYERENGLLSQWRGYGTNGRFAIVLDTKKMDELLKREWESFNYINLDLGSTTYYEGIDSLSNYIEYSKLIEKSIHLISSIIFGNSPKEKQEKLMQELFIPFIKTATFLKHRAFKEEREKRIVAIPFSPDVLSLWGIPLDHMTDQRTLKQTFNGVGKEHIRLFEGLETCLPIKRIIVGPGKNQMDDFQFAEKETKGKIELVKSETPFIG